MVPPVEETGKKIAAPVASGTELIMHRAERRPTDRVTLL
jgi:hypothetical protein